jgi:hypothetical protein
MTQNIKQDIINLKEENRILEKLGAMTNLIKFCKYTKKDYEMIATQG